MTNQGFSIDMDAFAAAPAAPAPEQTEAQAAAAPRRGRPRNVATRQPSREPIREPMRAESGRVMAQGHNGEVLTRRRSADADPFAIPEHIIPEGWSYQWNAVSVVGNTDVVMDKGMGYYENGWRPVPAERHPGMFVPRGTTGAILRGGLRLEERPLSLTLEAQEEARQTARQLMIDKTQSVMGRMNKALPDGFVAPTASQRRQYPTGGDQMRISIDKGLDIPAGGSYELAND